MKNRFTILSLVVSASLLLNSCSEEQTKKERPAQPVKVIEVLKVDLPIYKEFVGSIYGYKDIPIRARVEGFLESVDFKEGNRVKKGQITIHN